MPSDKISFLCTYDSTNDQLNIDSSSNLEDLDSDQFDTVVEISKLAIGGMNNAIEAVAPSGNGAGIYTSSRGFLFDFSIGSIADYKQSKQTYGDDAVKAAIAASGKSFVEASFNAAGATTGKIVGELIGAAISRTWQGKLAGLVVGGVVSSVYYENNLKKPLAEVVSHYFPPFLTLNPLRPDSSRISIGYEDPNDSSAIVSSEVLTSYNNPTTGSSLVTDRGSNMMIMNDGENDIFYIEDFSGTTTVNDLGTNAHFVIGNGDASISLMGNAIPRTDADGNVIPGKWSLNGFDLVQSGDDLIMVQAGGDPLDANTGKVVIKDFPFTQDRAFGISLGKVPDIVKNPDGTETAVDSELIRQEFLDRREDSRPMVDDRGRVSMINHPRVYDEGFGREIGLNELLTINVNDGSIIGRQEFPAEYSRGSNIFDTRSWYRDELSHTGEQRLISFVSDYNMRVHGAPDRDYGVTRIDVDNGKVAATYDISRHEGIQGARGNGIFKGGVGTLDGDLCFTYFKDDVPHAIRIDRESLVPYGEAVEFNSLNPGAAGVSVSNGRSISNSNNVYEMPGGKSVRHSGTFVEFIIPKLRDLDPSEIIPNYSLPPGSVEVTNPTFPEQIINFEKAANDLLGAQLQVTPAPNSVTFISGLSASSGSKINLSAFGLDQADVSSRISSVTQSQYSPRDLLSGQYQGAVDQRRRLQVNNGTVANPISDFI